MTLLPPDQSARYESLRDGLLVRCSDGSVAPYGKVRAPHQQDFADATSAAFKRVAGFDVPAPHRWFMDQRHRGAAKSTDAVYAVLPAATLSAAPLRCVVVATDREAAGVYTQLVVEAFRLNPALAKLWKVDRWKFTCKRNGSEIEAMSSDASSFFGQLVDVMVCDEFTMWPREDLWTSVISTMAKRDNAVLLGLFNAGWYDSWQARAVEAMRGVPHVWHRAMDHVAPWIGEKQLAAQKRLLCDTDYRRLWLNQWVPGVSDGIAHDAIERAVVLPGPMGEAPEGGMVIGGLDLGLRRDHSSFAALNLDFAHGRVQLAEMIDWKPPAGGRLDIGTIGDRVLDVCRRLGVRKVFYDSWQAEMLAAELRKRNIRMEAVHASSNVLTEQAVALMEAFNDDRVDLFADDLLLHDLKRCSIVDRPTGKRVQSPRDEHGHGDRLSAFLLPLPVALRAVSRPRRTGPVGRLAISGLGQVLNSSGQFQTLDHAERVVLQRARQLRGPSVF